MSRILIVEEPGAWRAELAGALRAVGYCCEECGPSHTEEALGLEPRLRSGRFDAAIVAFRSVADEWILESLSEAPSAPVLLALAASPEPTLVVRALQAGAGEVLRKPFRLSTLERLLHRLLCARSARSSSRPGETFVTGNPGVLEMLRRAERLAAGDVTLEITGEIGTGRRLLARRIHALSGRRAAPRVDIDCGLLTDVSDDFDWMDGSGEIGRSCGGLPSGGLGAADGGTLLLHEVAELPWRLQGGLLRILQGAEGDAHSNASPGLDIRLISTARRRLSEEMEAGRLRRELGYRLDVVALRIPPLRERPEDIPLLARHQLVRVAANLGCEPPGLGEDGSAALAQLPLPGNARELDRLMRRAVLLFPGGQIDMDRLMSGSPRGPQRLASSVVDTLNLREIERRTILRSLAEAKGNRTHASRALGISTRTLRNKIRNYGLA